MRILLDTHIALWAVVGSRALPARARQAILAADDVFVSVASVWELAIKHAIGKDEMPVSAGQAVQAFEDAGYQLLDIRLPHVVRVEQLPLLHKDPFDRLLVAQAHVEPLTLITADEHIGRYGGPVMCLA